MKETAPEVSYTQDPDTIARVLKRGLGVLSHRSEFVYNGKDFDENTAEQIREAVDFVTHAAACLQISVQRALLEKKEAAEAPEAQPDVVDIPAIETFADVTALPVKDAELEAVAS